MKFLRIGVRFWITIASVFSFVMGWVMLAHAPKPNQAGSTSTNAIAPLPTLEPLNPFSSSDLDEDNFQTQPFFNRQPSINSQFRPAFRTGGS